MGMVIRDMCTRNRTTNAEGGREEAEGLDEIDKPAMEKINKKLDSKQRTNLDIMRTGVTWTRKAAFWAGQSEDSICQLCHEDEEIADNICGAAKLCMKKERSSTRISPN